MRFVAVDTETFLIRPGRLAPPLVCVSYAERKDGRLTDGLLDHVDGVEFVRECLLDPDVTLDFHNAPYDLAVLGAEDPSLIPLIFKALAENRIADTQVREQLIMIARGDMTFQNVRVEESDDEDEDDSDDEDGESPGWKRIKKRYTLDALSLHYLHRALDKADDGWRLRYAQLRGVPINQWPERAIAYAKGDAVTTLEVFEAQAPTRDDDPMTPALDQLVSPDERMQVCAAFALHLCACWGLRTDADRIDDLETKLMRIQTGLGVKLLQAGLLKKKREKGVERLARSMKPIRALIVAECRDRAMPIPLTKKGIEITAAGNAPAAGEELVEFLGKFTSTSKDTLEHVASFPYPESVRADDRSLWLAGHAARNADKDGPEVPGLAAESFAAQVREKPARALEPLVAFANTQKILGTYVKPMRLGVVTAMNSRPNVLVETGRTSWGAMTLNYTDGTDE